VTCHACTVAADNPDTGLYGADCQECQARSLAQDPRFFDAMSVASFTHAYRGALNVVFGPAWMRGHECVLAWSRRIELARRERKAAA
jgi:hypothetical protein